MYISTKDWKNYIAKLSALDQKAGQLVQEWVQENGFGNTQELIDYAYGAVTKYSEGSAALSAQMYDALAEAAGKFYEPAEMAPTPTYGEVAKTVQGTIKQSKNPNTVSNAVSRLVKRTGADTTLNNAMRDGAEFAWVPNGDTCAFCIMLASRGWQRMSKNALRNGHAEHIHANCDCTYAIRFDNKSGVAGYDPEKYADMYYEADGYHPMDKVNAIRRMQYQENKDRINAQKREAYAARRLTENVSVGKIIPSKKGSSEDPDIKRTIVKESIIQGTVLDDVNTMLQLAHTEAGNDGLRSYLYGDIDDARALYKKLRGTGSPLIDKNGNWSKKERVKNDKPVGIWVNPVTGEKEETNAIMIVYSKTGAHLYPRKG